MVFLRFCLRFDSDSLKTSHLSSGLVVPSSSTSNGFGLGVDFPARGQDELKNWQVSILWGNPEGVHRSFSVLLTSILLSARSSDTTSLWPFSQAMKKGVEPLFSGSFTSTFVSVSKNCTTDTRPSKHASLKAVKPYLDLASLYWVLCQLRAFSQLIDFPCQQHPKLLFLWHDWKINIQIKIIQKLKQFN